MWLGGLCPVPKIRSHCVQPAEWDRCLIRITGDNGPVNDLPKMKIQYDLMTDSQLFMDVDGFLVDSNDNPEISASADGQSNVPYIFWPPTHSVFMTRLA